MKLVFKGLPVILLMISMVGCSSTQLVDTLEAVVSATEVALPILATTVGLSPIVIQMIENYLSLVNNAAGQAATILSGATTTSQEKASEILAMFAGVVSSLNLPAGTPTEVVNVTAGVSKAVASFLANFNNPTKGNIKVNMKDKIRLEGIRNRTVVMGEKLAARKK